MIHRFIIYFLLLGNTSIFASETRSPQTSFTFHKLRLLIPEPYILEKSPNESYAYIQTARKDSFFIACRKYSKEISRAVLEEAFQLEMKDLSLKRKETYYSWEENIEGNLIESRFYIIELKSELYSIWLSFRKNEAKNRDFFAKKFLEIGDFSKP
ncbi:MAG: hypothetical protein KDK45_06975 [Leptospiraceae bacterium]|nr:hypothetical protein [Leptospiraceae bacterium]